MAALPQLTRNLDVGMTGSDVTQLQQYLISQGYSIPAGATGYYGDQTKAAVTAWQKASGVQPAQQSDYGSFGPLSRQALAAPPASAPTGESLKEMSIRLAKAEQGNPDLAGLLDDPTLTPDQKSALSSIYEAVSTNDQAYADRLKAGIAAGTQYSDPFFKAQSRLVTDALDRSFKAADGDFGYQNSQLQNSLADLRADIAASRESLSLDEQAQLDELDGRYSEELDRSHSDLAARGLSSSSIRARSDEMLEDSYSDMRQSVSRRIGERKASLDRNLGSAERNTALEVARLGDLAARGRLAALRSAEQKVGSKALQGLGYSNTLSDIPGEIERARAQDALSFASGYIF